MNSEYGDSTTYILGHTILQCLMTCNTHRMLPHCIMWEVFISWTMGMFVGKNSWPANVGVSTLFLLFSVTTGVARVAACHPVAGCQLIATYTETQYGTHNGGMLWTKQASMMLYHLHTYVLVTIWATGSFVTESCYTNWMCVCVSFHVVGFRNILALWSQFVNLSPNKHCVIPHFIQTNTYAHILGSHQIPNSITYCIPTYTYCLLICWNGQRISCNENEYLGSVSHWQVP